MGFKAIFLWVYLCRLFCILNLTERKTFFCYKKKLNSHFQNLLSDLQYTHKKQQQKIKKMEDWKFYDPFKHTLIVAMFLDLESKQISCYVKEC